MNLIRRTAAAIRAFKHDFTTTERQLTPEEWSHERKYPRIFSTIYGSSDRALQIGTVYACSKILGEDVGSLPLFMFERSRDRKESSKAYDHPLYEKLHDLSNPDTSAISFRESLTSAAALTGMGYARIARNSQNDVAALWQLAPSEVTRDKDQRGNDHFLVTERGGPQKTYARKDIFTLPGFSFDGYIGNNVLKYACKSIGLADSAQAYAQEFFDNDHTPGVVLEHPGKLTLSAIELMKEAWKKAVASHGVAVTSEGIKVNTYGQTNDKAQLIEQRKFQVVEICRWFRMPPHKLADLDRAHFTNVEQQDTDYFRSTLRPWLVRWEQAVYRNLLSVTERTKFFAEHSVEGFLRGDFKTQTEGFRSMLEKGVFSINEVRAFLNQNPIPDGDNHHIQMNMTDIRDAATAAVGEAA